MPSNRPGMSNSSTVWPAIRAFEISIRRKSTFDRSWARCSGTLSPRKSTASRTGLSAPMMTTFPGAGEIGETDQVIGESRHVTHLDPPPHLEGEVDQSLATRRRGILRGLPFPARQKCDGQDAQDDPNG